MTRGTARCLGHRRPGRGAGCVAPWLWLWVWLFRVFFMKWMNEWRLLYKVARRETTGMRAFVLWPDVSADQSPACLALSISLTQTRWGRPLLKEQTTTRARCLVFIM
jgi:hypothetical protein